MQAAQQRRSAYHVLSAMEPHHGTQLWHQPLRQSRNHGPATLEVRTTLGLAISGIKQLPTISYEKLWDHNNPTGPCHLITIELVGNQVVATAAKIHPNLLCSLGLR